MDCNSDTESEETSTKGFPCVILGWFLGVFSIVCFFGVSLMAVGIVALFIGNFSIATPDSVPSQCKIVSSTVDLRSSKVCELGLLNYKAKRVFYPFERSKFRCRYDYYWASVFKVEYKDHFSDQTRLALAEAPNEALPHNCRPNFGVAWLTKDKFKVNKTYDCWYTSGISKVSLYHDGFFHCQAKDPSAVEMMRRYSILSMKIFSSWFSDRERAKFWRWETVGGVLAGFSTSLITISFIKILQEMKSWLPGICVARMLRGAVNTVWIKRACFFMAYFSVAGWLAIQYVKRIGH